MHLRNRWHGHAVRALPARRRDHGAHARVRERVVDVAEAVGVVPGESEGTKQEAITATRALCGYRVRRVEEFSSDPELAARIPRECERAGGRVWWWVPRAWGGEDG